MLLPSILVRALGLTAVTGNCCLFLSIDMLSYRIVTSDVSFPDSYTLTNAYYIDRNGY